MNSSHVVELKLLCKCFHRIDLLTNRIKKNIVKLSCGSKRNTWKACTGTHIEDSFNRIWNIGFKKQGVEDMENNGIV